MTTEEWFEKGVALDGLGRHEEALDAYNKAIEIDPQFTEAWYGKGFALGRLDRDEEALDAFNKVIEIDPQFTEAWYGKGFVLGELERYKDALAAYNKAIEIDPQFTEAWYGKGFALGELERYKDALAAYNKAIEIDPQDALAYSNSAEVLFNLGAIKEASTNVNQAISLNDKLTSALLVRGKIEIEKKEYAEASQTFDQAISSDLGNPLPLLWKTYAQYLQAEFSANPASEEYREEMAGIIRQLERANDLFKKSDKKLRAYILYFLGCFHYKTKDIFEAKRKLEECLRLNSKSPIESSARELLDNIWNYAIRPPFWQWWLDSPLKCWTKRIIFGVISFSILALLLAHPFIPAWLPTAEINWILHIVLILFLIIILVLPNIQRIRARDIVEVELRSPPAIEPVLSPPMMEMKIKELEAFTEQ